MLIILADAVANAMKNQFYYVHLSDSTCLKTKASFIHSLYLGNPRFTVLW